jgi:hypothetical protein
MPPSTTICTPVGQLDRFDARHSATRPISSGSAIRGMGIPASVSSASPVAAERWSRSIGLWKSTAHTFSSLTAKPPKPTRRAPVPRLAFNQKEAAALGISVDHFERHIMTHVPTVYSGSLRLNPCKVLEEWLEESCSFIRDTDYRLHS